MKIETQYPLPLITGKTGSPAKASEAKPGSSTEVHVSGAAALLAAGEETPPIDTAKVEEIKQAISEGLFKINPEAIADGLIETSRQLLAERK